MTTMGMYGLFTYWTVLKEKENEGEPDHDKFEREMNEDLIRKAPNDYDIAEEVLAMLCDAMENAKLYRGTRPVDWPLFDYGIAAIRRILDGKMPDVALNLVWPEGKGRQISRDRTRDVSARYNRYLEIALAVRRCQLNGGKTVTEAKEHIVENDVLISELAKMSPEEYARERLDYALSMEITPEALDRQVEERRKGGEPHSDNMVKTAWEKYGPLAQEIITSPDPTKPFRYVYPPSKTSPPK